jgi:hypothetical protein
MAAWASWKGYFRVPAACTIVSKRRKTVTGKIQEYMLHRGQAAIGRR